MSSNEDTEFLTEHFGYPPVSLLDDIINSINILAERALTSIETGLQQQPPASLGFRPHQPKKTRKNAEPNPFPPPADPEDAKKLEIENGTHQLETLLCASIDKNFDVFEIYVMRNILCVKPGDREWIQLAHYQGLDFQAASNGDGPSLEGVNALRRRLQASTRLHAMLVNEKARNEVLLRQLGALVKGEQPPVEMKKEAQEGEVRQEDVSIPTTTATTTSGTTTETNGLPRPFAFLDQKRAVLASADATAPLETTGAFVLSQLTALRALSSSLRDLTPDLSTMVAKTPGAEEGGGGGDGTKTWRTERIEYVEGETRKHLEYVRGLELEDDGAVRDGEWQGEGRSMGRGEAEALEMAVAVLETGKDVQQRGGKGDSDEMDTT